MEDSHSMERLSSKVRSALESADLDALGELLDPNARWGPPGDPSRPCKNRKQVLAWYERAKTAGATASVSEITVLGERLLVALRVRGTSGSRQRGDLDRWQLLSVSGGLIVEIVGFGAREDAETFAENSNN